MMKSIRQVLDANSTIIIVVISDKRGKPRGLWKPRGLIKIEQNK